MAERPILFSAEMVQAILAGNKTQTRRVFKQVECRSCKNVGEIHKLKKDGSMSIRPCPKCHGETKCPHGQVGDRLWVRETWSTHACFDDVSSAKLKAISFHYWADGNIKTGKVRPSVHMPRLASRILLEITNIRVERLQSISEHDAIAEGCDNSKSEAAISQGWYEKPVKAFFRLWESINGRESLDANPWVWVITFKVVEIKQ